SSRLLAGAGNPGAYAAGRLRNRVRRIVVGAGALPDATRCTDSPVAARRELLAAIRARQHRHDHGSPDNRSGPRGPAAVPVRSDVGPTASVSGGAFLVVIHGGAGVQQLLGTGRRRRGPRRCGPADPAGSALDRRRLLGTFSRGRLLLSSSSQGFHRLPGNGHGTVRAPDARRHPPPAGRRSDDRRGGAKRVRSWGVLVWTDRPGEGVNRTMTLLLSAWTVGLILALLA